jgi:hypothetical protein
MSAAASRRTFQPVRRNSRHEGEREHLVWRPIGSTPEEARRFIGALIKAAEQLDRETKAPGKQMGALGLSGLHVLRALCGIVSYRSGRLEPSIAYIQERTKLARATVVRALARLKQHGFLNWMRRTAPTDNQGEAGPQVRQIPNAYWFGLKDQALAMVKRLLGRTPPTAPAEPPAQPPPARARSKAAAFASLQAFSEDPALQGALSLIRERALRRSASSERSQNPAQEQDI